jgi:hypothetical protein
VLDGGLKDGRNGWIVQQLTGLGDCRSPLPGLVADQNAARISLLGEFADGRSTIKYDLLGFGVGRGQVAVVDVVVEPKRTLFSGHEPALAQVA